MNITNDFGTLSAESAESHYAQFTPEEHQECQEFLDQEAANFEAARHAECDEGEFAHGPEDRYLDASWEDRAELGL